MVEKENIVLHYSQKVISRLFLKNHVGFAPKNININTHKIEIDCECGKPNAVENMIGCEGINKLWIKLTETQKQDNSTLYRLWIIFFGQCS